MLVNNRMLIAIERKSAEGIVTIAAIMGYRNKTNERLP
jgi:hypothetical protein